MKITTTLKVLKFIDTLKAWGRSFAVWVKGLVVLIFYMLMVSGITFGLLQLIYLFKPDEAYVYLAYDPDSCEVEYVEAETINIAPSVNWIDVYIDTEMEIMEINGYRHTFFYNGINYSTADYALMFVPNPLHEEDGDIDRKKYVGEIAVPGMRIAVNDDSSFLIRAISDNDIAECNIYKYKIDSIDGRRIMMDDSKVLMSSGIWTIIEYTKSINIVDIYACELFLVNRDTEEKILIERSEAYGDSIITIIDETGDDESNLIIENEVYIYFSSFTPPKSISFESLKEIKLKSKGELSFYYSPTPTIYDIKNQFIYLKNNAYNIDFTEKTTDSGIEYELSGMVTTAELSNMNLFPSFEGWYRDNVLLAPLTLITVIGGGITLMISNRKEKDER